MSPQGRIESDQQYCVCKNAVCVSTQQLLSRYKGCLPSNNAAAQWCQLAGPIAVCFDHASSHYQTWMLVISICYHIPEFLKTFLECVDDFRLPIQGGRPTSKKWLINRLHFPGVLLLNRQLKKIRLKQNTTLMTPSVAKALESLDRGRTGSEGQLTNSKNSVGFLEHYAETVLPPNVYQEFLLSKNRLKKKIPSDYLVQAPGVSWEEVVTFCSSLKIGWTKKNTIINNVPSRGLAAACVLPRPLEPSKPFQPRILATLYRHGVTKVVAIDDGSPHLAMTGIPIRLPKGGLLKTYPRMVDTDEAIQVTTDLLANPSVFGQHRVNGFNPEPRVQAHFHHEATEDFYGRPQPGYRYNLITMKSRQLQSVPSLCQLAERCRKLCKVPQWNIGTTVVLYRDGNDKMGQHKGTCVGGRMLL